MDVTELLNCPVIAVTPFDATEPVRAVAMSAKSLLTAADEITVPGTKGAVGSVYIPDELRGKFNPSI